jgi:hypothetical protein
VRRQKDATRRPRAQRPSRVPRMHTQSFCEVRCKRTPTRETEPVTLGGGGWNLSREKRVCHLPMRPSMSLTRLRSCRRRGGAASRS